MLPDLSRFEMQVLRRLWHMKEASVRTVYDTIQDPPSYSTVRKIIERLEEKGAVERVGMDGKAVVYRSTVSSKAMIRKEIGRFLDTLFDGSAAPLVEHLADMDALSLEEIRELENRLNGSHSTESEGDNRL
jgi:BlaI family penicillinase repressor